MKSIINDGCSLDGRPRKLQTESTAEGDALRSRPQRAEGRHDDGHRPSW